MNKHRSCWLYVCVRLFPCKTKTKDCYLENRKQSRRLWLLPSCRGHTAAQTTNPVISHQGKNVHFTVHDGDVSAFVVLGQCHRRSLGRGHNANCAAAVRALQVGRGSQLRGLDAQTLWEREGLLGAVSTVGLVPPLDHWGLGGSRLVLTWQHHGLEEHRKPLLLPHDDIHTVTDTHWHTDRERRWELVKLCAASANSNPTNYQHLANLLLKCSNSSNEDETLTVH